MARLAGPASARLSRRVFGLAAGGLLALLSLSPSHARAEAVDLELLLAVDTSLSVSDEEFKLQMLGLAAAFVSPAVIAAIEAVGDLGIAVSLMQWSDRNQQAMAVDWTRVVGPASALAFSKRISAAPRLYAGAGTSISGIITKSVPLFAENGFEAPRRVLDISGDGIDNRGPFPRTLQPLAVAAGITVNGLTILNEEPFLDRYFERSVITGTGAFVIAAADYHDFARAIIAKLVREISSAPMAALPAPDTRLSRR